MFGQMFSSAEIVSSMILGGATMGAASLNVLNEARKAKRVAKETGPQGRGWLRRPLLILGVTAVGVGCWVTYTATGLKEAQALAGPRAALRKLNPRADGAKKATTPTKPNASKVAPAAVPAVTLPVAAAPKASLHEEWLQTEGTKLYYRYLRYLPDACPGTPIAIGNWVDGESRPVDARCLEGGWLALDLGPLVADGRLVPNMTYCLQFRASNGAWGLQVPDHAPGIDSISVPAVRVPLGKAIGIRYLPGNPRERVVPTADTPRAPC
jgi:hypothetical protein